MGINVADLEVEVSADTDQASRELHRFSQQVGRESSGLFSGMSRDAQGTHGHFTSLFSTVATQGVQAFATFGKVAAAAVAGVSTAALGLYSAMSLAAAAAVGFGVKFLGELEQAEIGFTSMLHSADKAKSMMEELKKFAATSPFEMEGVIDGARRLLAMGFAAEQVLPMMRSVGDAVAAMGGGKEMIDSVIRALGQMKAKGKATAEEINTQLAEQGIPMWDMLAKKLGVDIPTAMKMVTDGAVDADTAIAAFMEGTAARFGGAMDKQSQTLLGMLSTLKDNVKLGLAGIAEKVFEQIKGVMPELSKGIADLMSGPAVGGFADAISALVDVIIKSLPAVGDYLGTVLEQMTRFFEALQPAIEPIIDLLGSVAASFGWVATSIVHIIGPIADALRPILLTLSSFVGIIVEDFGKQLLPVLEDLQPVFFTLAKTVADVAGEAFKGLGTILVNLLPVIQPLIPMLGDILISAIRDLVQIALPLIPIIGDIAKVFLNELGRALPEVLPQIGIAAKLLGEGLLEAVRTLLPIITDLVIQLAPLIPNFAMLAVTLLENLLPLLEPLAQGFLDLATEMVGTVDKPGPLIGFMEDLANAMLNLTPKTLELGEKLLQTFVDHSDEIIEFVQTVTDALIIFNKVIYPIANVLIGIFYGFMDIVGAVSKLINKLGELGGLIGIGGKAGPLGKIAGILGSGIGVLAGFLGDTSGGGRASGRGGRLAADASAPFGGAFDRSGRGGPTTINVNVTGAVVDGRKLYDLTVQAAHRYGADMRGGLALSR